VALYRETDAAGDAESVLAVADGAVIDEEALRDLVAEIVREELRGEMGERVTRNVRKLVRREIRRALNAQDFD
jgi:2-hydroxychromene-2-carboxylate isomerase